MHTYKDRQNPNPSEFRIPILKSFETIILVSALSEFAIAGIHVKPDDAVIEVDYLSEVYDDIVDVWGLQVMS